MPLIESGTYNGMASKIGQTFTFDRKQTSLNVTNNDSVNKMVVTVADAERTLYAGESHTFNEEYDRFTIKTKKGTASFTAVSSGSVTEVKAAIANLGGDMSEANTILTNLLQKGIKAIVNPPTITSFSVTNPSTTEIGTTITTLSTAWEVTNEDGIKALDVYDSTNNVLLGTITPIAATGTKDIPVNLVKTTTGTIKFKLKVVDGNDVEIDSTEDSIGWYYKVYVGNNPNESLDAAGVKNLSIKSIKGSRTGTYTIPATYGYKYIAYPKIFGLATSFKDASNADIAMQAPVELTVTNDYGLEIVYYVYRTTDITALAVTVTVA